MNAFSDPQTIIEQLDIKEGHHVADLGTGAGNYSLALAEKYRHASYPIKIFALDVQKDLVERLEKEVLSRGISSIHPLWANIEDPKGTRLRDASVDWVFIINTLFQVPDKEGLLNEAFRILKPGGKLLVIDWSQTQGSLGPRATELIPEEQALSLVYTHSFVFDKKIENTGSYHYGFVVIKK